MKFTIVSTNLLCLFFSVAVQAKEEVYKFKFKENSNTASIDTFWKTDKSCVEPSYFSLFATDGYIKVAGGDKETIKSVNGYATLYSNCKDGIATRTELSFFSSIISEPAPALVFSQLKNVTIDATMTAYFSKSKCVIQTYDFFEFESTESEVFSYYVCGDEIDSGKRPISIHTVLAPPTDFSDEYTSIEKGVSRGPGFLLKSDTNSRCKTTVATKNVITLGKKNPIVFSSNSDDFVSKICKVKSGATERIKFTDK